MKGWYVAAVLWVLSVPLLACGADSPPVRSEFVLDSAGVAVITHRGIPEAEPRLLALDSSWPTDIDVTFGELVDLEVMPDGRVAILDRMNARVTVLSPDGNVEASFGGRGEGPGEFSQSVQNIVSTDSTVLVPDVGLQRITEFSTDGAVMATRWIMGGEALGVGAYFDWRRHPQGGFAAKALGGSEQVIVRVSERGIDTLYTSQIAAEPVMLEPVLIWDLDSEGRVIAARSDQPEVRRQNTGTGEVDRIVRGLGASRAFTVEDREHILDLFMLALAEVTGEPLPRSQMEAFWEGIESPDHAPLFSALYVSPEGRYWIQRAGPVQSIGAEGRSPAEQEVTAEALGTREWWVLSPDGTLEEVAVLPERFLPRRFSGPWIYGIASDPFDVQAPARVRR